MWGGTAEPTSRDQNKMQEREQEKGNETKSHKQEESLGAQTEAARQSRLAPPATERKEEPSTCASTGITIALCNVRTMAVDGAHGVERALDVLSMYDRLGCDVIGLQETRAAVDIQPSARLATSCTAAVNAVTRMVGRRCKVE